MKYFLITGTILTLLLSCAKKPADSCEVKPLKDLASYPIGAAFNYFDYQTSNGLSNTFDQHFNSLTPENALKMKKLMPSEGTYAFGEAEYLIALMNGKGRVHGHTLLWHQEYPWWLDNYQRNYTDLMTGYITDVVSHFRGQINSWDVVNEGLNEDGTLRSTIWLKNVGSDYIYTAFKAAREADPDLELFYNDYNLAINPKKLDAAIKLCKNLEARGIDVAGIGMQMHIGLSFPSRRELADAVEKIWRAGFKVHFSELDVSVNILGSKDEISDDDWEEQRKKYYQVVSVYNQIPEQFQFGITMWGVGDADSWLPSYFDRLDGGLLFDHAYQPKPAYCGFKNALE